MKRTIKTLVAAGVVGSTAVLAGAYFGVVNVGADDPHFPAVHAFLSMARDRSIEVRSRDIEVPNLDDQALIRAGAGNYNSMCIGCHLAPGVAETELSQSLYPAPPNLAKIGVDGNPAATFWVIKHGIKATGMPAWGKSMGDQYIWGMVAFLNQLPTMDAKQYQTLVASSGGHQHGGGETQMHNHEGQHGDNKPGHHGNSGGGEDHHGSGDAGEPGHHDAAATGNEGGSTSEADHHSNMNGDDHHAGDETPSNGGGHHSEQAPNASPKTHTHSDGKEHVHES
ncbi:cytochrome c [Pseudomonas aeruginosa]|uniref:Cytochrome c n=1 Tax=Ectopseudomonas toyotomiensis TaxID=554344 RepID=A0ABD7DVL8_9GAMM|nr:cytochrome c [Pseudomonas toyotomiensis]MCT1346571.1 cytochrome c [Pseudomonas aeruginosa]QSL92556.1 cytochrome c [Pseudomonas toyotomiensis]